MENMSRRARETLQEELEFGGAKEEEEVTGARLVVTQAMGRLDKAGELKMEG